MMDPKVRHLRALLHHVRLHTRAFGRDLPESLAAAVAAELGPVECSAPGCVLSATCGEIDTATLCVRHAGWAPEVHRV